MPTIPLRVSFTLNYPAPSDAKTRSYGYKVSTKGFRAGTYEIEFVAGSDPTVQRVRFSLR